jgi:hypothetical protein
MNACLWFTGKNRNIVTSYLTAEGADNTTVNGFVLTSTSTANVEAMILIIGK